MQLTMPMRRMPAVQRVSVRRVLQSLLNVGRGVSVLFIYIALTMRR